MLRMGALYFQNDDGEYTKLSDNVVGLETVDISADRTPFGVSYKSDKPDNTSIRMSYLNDPIEFTGSLRWNPSKKICKMLGLSYTEVRFPKKKKRSWMRKRRRAIKNGLVVYSMERKKET